MTKHTNSKVFITQDDGRFDLSSLAQYGEVEALFGRSVYPDDAGVRVPVMHKIANSKLAKFDPDRDFLALAGDPASVAVVVAVLTRKLLDERRNQFNVLKWDGVARGYYPIMIVP